MERGESLLLLPQQPSPYATPSARSSTTRVDIQMQDTDQNNQPDPDPAPVPETEPKTPEPEPQPFVQTPQTFLTFLLVSGRRRTMPFDPATTVGRVKELVWAAWPPEQEWQDERPPAPAYLRILYLGKILQDEDTLASPSFLYLGCHFTC
ncbi:hypothetical protein B0H11DRAFT_2133120 [Mycena galericulata]|nr:hypothetical protein B0H11DRAFT_2133120 [Mycena galericulata]